MEKFSFETFTNLMKIDLNRAIEYRDNCHASLKKDNEDPQVVEFSEEKEIKWEENQENILEVNPDDFTWDNEEIETIIEEVIIKEETQTIEFTREELIEKLQEAKIFIPPKIKDETLLKKCIENNLI